MAHKAQPLWPQSMDLIERIGQELDTDRDDTARQAERLEWEYRHATEDEQKAVDRIFIALCGWSLRTLIDGRESPDYNPYSSSDGARRP